MRPAIDRCSIVMVGAWNQPIFAPPWIAAAFGLKGQQKMQIVFAAGATMFRFEIGSARLDVSSHQLQVAPLEFSDDAISQAERIATAILTKLPETPVSGVGVNFGFDIAEPTDALVRLFQGSDASFAGIDGVKVEKTTVAYQLKLAEQTLILSAICAEPGTQLDFNFHNDVKDAGMAKTLLAGRVLDLRTQALRFAESAFRARLEGT